MNTNNILGCFRKQECWCSSVDTADCRTFGRCRPCLQCLPHTNEEIYEQRFENITTEAQSNLRQPASSLLSPQSSTSLQTNNSLMHFPLKHLYSPGLLRN